MAEAVTLADGIIEKTFELLRSCGGGRAECVVYWVGSGGDRCVTEVVHPAHTATRYEYAVDSGWLTRFFGDNHSSGSRILAQVHTHPGPASHSDTDDSFCILPVAGFLSLVIPRFATGPTGFEDSFLVEMQRNGLWQPRDPYEVFGL